MPIHQDGVNRGRRVRRERCSQNRGAAQRTADRFSWQIRLAEGRCGEHDCETNQRASTAQESSIAHCWTYPSALACAPPAVLCAGFSAEIGGCNARALSLHMVVVGRPFGTLRPVEKENPMTTHAPATTRQHDPRTANLLPGTSTILRATGRTTNGAFGLVEQSMPPGFASPYTHHLEDEAFYVLEGEMAFVCDGQWTIAGPGACVFGPREIPHGFKVLGDAAARMLLLCTPGGFSEFVVEMSEPIPAPRHGQTHGAGGRMQVDILGPLPEQADAPATTTTARSSTSLKNAVDRIRAQHIAAVNAGDIGAALEIFASNGTVMPPGQPALQGASLREWFTYVFANVSLQGFEIRPDAVERCRECRDRTWQLERHAPAQEWITKPARRWNLPHCARASRTATCV